MQEEIWGIPYNPWHLFVNLEINAGDNKAEANSWHHLSVWAAYISPES